MGQSGRPCRIVQQGSSSSTRVEPAASDEILVVVVGIRVGRLQLRPLERDPQTNLRQQRLLLLSRQRLQHEQTGRSTCLQQGKRVGRRQLVLVDEVDAVSELGRMSYENIHLTRVSTHILIISVIQGAHYIERAFAFEQERGYWIFSWLLFLE